MKITIPLTLVLALTLASCLKKEEAANNNPSSSLSLDELVLDSAPDTALDIAILRKQAKASDTVSFTGEVIGSDPVFLDGRAIMIVGDPKKITACNKIPGDSCERPWDVCCDDPDVITASIVTVQVVDEEGKLVKKTLRGVGGVKELSTVTVTGEVAEGSNDSNMLINAAGIFVHPNS